ncbi:phosphoribosylanthranilate isomerase [Flavobacterium luminosum]|uniref:N-(5'-phosphoribosyl)anthranilate isomerase n=1 Tax=Flavobacterium luminosum TaxID=2949086 RepID=A0ABT0TNN3_9FLAO|nr:phosphoribosylanthranilate isomerase [Flavobacterium sp. HXWNR70]MCL9808876.1 phosphoribosylanthranilate isomerase [Flavobacterium sp. HXWNR70]
MKLKICGMKYPENIQEVAAILPDYMGFIFYKKSPRFFNGEIPTIPNSIQKVGVFVNATLEEIITKTLQYELDLVQLHGNETPQFCTDLKTELDHQKKETVKIIKAFPVNDFFDFNNCKPYETTCDFFLFDTKGENPGGNGTSFDWQVLKDYSLTKPFFLSGGIGLDKTESLKQLKLPIYAIDVNSKFETKPGNKNIQLLKKLQHELSR